MFPKNSFLSLGFTMEFSRTYSQRCYLKNVVLAQHGGACLYSKRWEARGLIA